MCAERSSRKRWVGFTLGAVAFSTLLLLQSFSSPEPAFRSSAAGFRGERETHGPDDNDNEQTSKNAPPRNADIDGAVDDPSRDGSDTVASSNGVGSSNALSGNSDVASQGTRSYTELSLENPSAFEPGAVDREDPELNVVDGKLRVRPRSGDKVGKGLKFAGATWDQLMQMAPLPMRTAGVHRDDDSAGRVAGSLAVTILAHRRPELLVRQMKAVAASTRGPSQITVSSLTVLCFASPVADAVRAAYEEAAADESIREAQFPSRLVVAPVDLRYSGMYQFALLEAAEFAAFLDDDFIPGSDFLGGAAHAVRVTGGPVGAAGWLFPAPRPSGFAPPSPRWVLPPYREGDLLGPWVRTEVLAPSDTVGGALVMRSPWVKLYFREELVEWRTGADMVVSYALPHYAGLVNHVMPAPGGRPSTWGFSDDFRTGTEQSRGATNSEEMVLRRGEVLHHLWRRGYPTVRGRAHYRSSEGGVATNPVFFFADTLGQAASLSGAVRAALADPKVRVVISTSGKYPDDEMRASLGLEVDRRSERPGGSRSGFDADFFCAMVDYDLPGRRLRAADVLAEVSLHLGNVLDIVRPRALVVPWGSEHDNREDANSSGGGSNYRQSPAVRAAILAAEFLGVRVVYGGHALTPDVLRSLTEQKQGK